ncbi:AAA family ATPase [Pseudonocardia sp. WMMC193]|uniref:AAA family ATPase n=1 Tax=Pseudonocardia sp. WMMC193 TaxID=2911965 RepID=UPI001F01E720|nr:AAA family ATPase [Pseudonocardia sp. WMMC193]MCF7547484.1 AAA family ATPase [Pseudonocardia sp. WMMC193]
MLGQAPALAAVEHALVIAQAGLHDRERPMGCVLLVGPTGVGKTELVRRLAAEIRSGPDDFCRIDMGQLAQEHYAASLAGAPPGYAGSRESSSIFDKATIEGTTLTPGIVLLDEVEKAHPLVLRVLLGALDHGRLTLANGEQTISFRNTFVFMTSNLGSRELARRRGRLRRRALDSISRTAGIGRAGPRAAAILLEKRDRAVVERAVKDFFEPEFLNRLDEVVYFDEISPETAEEIVALRLQDVRELFRRRDVEIVIGDGVVDALVELGFDPVNGARSLARSVRKHLVTPVAESLVRHRGATGPGVPVLTLRVDAVPTGRAAARLVVRPCSPDQARVRAG